MNPYLIIAALLAVLAAGAGGFRLGVDHEQAAQKREDDHIAQAVDAANAVTAAALSNMRPKFTTIKNEVQREIVNNPVYIDCRVPAAGVALVNRALEGATLPASAASAPRLPADRLRDINAALSGRAFAGRSGELPPPAGAASR